MKIVNRNRIFLVFALVLVLFLGFCSINAKSWKNSHKGGGAAPIYAYTVGGYQAAYCSPGESQKNYYGTHDWIAEVVLKVMYEHSITPTFIDLLYSDTNLYKMYYLLGTEAPDLKVRGYGDQISLTSCDGEIYGSQDLIYLPHNIRYNNLGVIVDSPLANGAVHAQASAIQAFKDRDCKKAAFFLGAMVHYISDAAAYCHLFTQSDIDTHEPSYVALNGHKNSFETRIAKLTWRPERYQAGDFFHWRNAKLDYASQYAMDYNAWTATYFMGLYTHQYRWELWDTYQAHRDDYFPLTSNDLYEWERIDFMYLEGAKKEYFERIEHILNKAIFYSAMAILDTVEHYDGCDCLGEKTDHQDVLDQLNHSTTISSQMMPYFIITGLASTFLAIGSLVMGIKSKRSL